MVDGKYLEHIMMVLWIGCSAHYGRIKIGHADACPIETNTLSLCLWISVLDCNSHELTCIQAA